MIDNVKLLAMKAYFYAVKYFLTTTVEIKVDGEQLILKTHDTLDFGLLWNFSQFFGWKFVDIKDYNGEFGRWIEYVFEEV